ncbi:MAG: PH domain-containing protein [Acidobacteriota bacterium]|nr:PH domain-containing protein [Acidobacteriota bacterium]
MAFPRRLLADDEEVVLELRPHWSSLGWPLPALAVSVAALVAAMVAWPSGPVAVAYVLGALCGVCVVWLVGRSIRRSTTSLVLTTSRLVQRSGILGRRGRDVRLTRINEIGYHQTLWQRLLGTGQLVVEVGGDRGELRFDHVPQPAAFAGELHEQLAALQAPRGDRGGDRRDDADDAGADDDRRRDWRQDRGGGTDRGGGGLRFPDDTPPAGVPAAASPSVAQQLIDLDELRRRGVLSREEYEEKRARLVDRL